MNIPAITVTIDTTEAVKALNELEKAIERVGTAFDNLTVSTVSPTAFRNAVSIDELTKRVADDLQLSFWKL